MEKYLINESMLHGYNEIDLKNTDLSTIKDSLVIAILDKSLDTEIGVTYRGIAQLLKQRNRIILISVDDQNKAFKPLASLLVQYQDYDIYEVDEKNDITADYLLKLEDRNPGLIEAQTFVGGDVTSFADMGTLLFAIESLVNEGDIEGLKNFVEENIGSFENLTVTLNNMKKTCDWFNSNELIEQVNELRENEEKLSKKLEQSDKEVKRLNDIKENRDKEIDELLKENGLLKSSNSDLKYSANSGGAVIKTFNEVNTRDIQCKAKSVLYFKEISYVKYTNTMITHLVEFLKRDNKKVKLIIYDSNNQLCDMYSGIQAVNGEMYIKEKSQLLQVNTAAFVVTEPIQSIIQDVLMSDNVYDVVVVYDRTKSYNDIVIGNNVTKITVVKSLNDYSSLQRKLKINELSYLLTDKNSRVLTQNPSNKNVMYVTDIADYNSNTPTAKMSKYIKMALANSNKSLFKYIMEFSNIDKL